MQGIHLESDNDADKYNIYYKNCQHYPYNEFVATSKSANKRLLFPTFCTWKGIQCDNDNVGKPKKDHIKPPKVNEMSKFKKVDIVSFLQSFYLSFFDQPVSYDNTNIYNNIVLKFEPLTVQNDTNETYYFKVKDVIGEGNCAFHSTFEAGVFDFSVVPEEFMEKLCTKTKNGKSTRSFHTIHQLRCLFFDLCEVYYEYDPVLKNLVDCLLQLQTYIFNSEILSEDYRLDVERCGEDLLKKFKLCIRSSKHDCTVVDICVFVIMSYIFKTKIRTWNSDSNFYDSTLLITNAFVCYAPEGSQVLKENDYGAYFTRPDTHIFNYNSPDYFFDFGLRGHPLVDEHSEASVNESNWQLNHFVPFERIEEAEAIQLCDLKQRKLVVYNSTNLPRDATESRTQSTLAEIKDFVENKEQDYDDESGVANYKVVVVKVAGVVVENVDSDSKCSDKKKTTLTTGMSNDNESITEDNDDEEVEENIQEHQNNRNVVIIDERDDDVIIIDDEEQECDNNVGIDDSTDDNTDEVVQGGQDKQKTHRPSTTVQEEETIMNTEERADKLLEDDEDIEQQEVMNLQNPDAPIPTEQEDLLCNDDSNDNTDVATPNINVILQMLHQCQSTNKELQQRVVSLEHTVSILREEKNNRQSSTTRKGSKRRNHLQNASPDGKPSSTERVKKKSKVAKTPSSSSTSTTNTKRKNCTPSDWYNISKMYFTTCTAVGSQSEVSQFAQSHSKVAHMSPQHVQKMLEKCKTQYVVNGVFSDNVSVQASTNRPTRERKFHVLEEAVIEYYLDNRTEEVMAEKCIDLYQHLKSDPNNTLPDGFKCSNTWLKHMKKCINTKRTSE